MWVPVRFLLCWLVCLVVWVGVLVVVGFVGGFCAASPPSAPIVWGDRLGLKLWVGLRGVCVCGLVGFLWVCFVVAVVVCASCFRPPSPGVHLAAMRGDGVSSYRFPGHRARSLGHPEASTYYPCDVSLILLSGVLLRLLRRAVAEVGPRPAWS